MNSPNDGPVVDSGCCPERAKVSAAAIVALLLLVAFVWQPMPASGQVGPTDEDKEIDAKDQAEIIDSVTATLNEGYVFPDVARKMAERLREQYENKAYRDLTSARQFADALTEDLREISKDRHLRVRFVPDEELAEMEQDTITDEAREKHLAEARRRNFGFVKVERLPGNIGYLDLRQFSDAAKAGATAVAAMNFLAYCDALIIDLRQNGGGSPSMIQLISSYFFDEPVHLNSFYIRRDDTTQQFWSHAYVDGPRMTDVDMYVLTSRRTFSAAEEFTYNLKHLERATIVGEITGGGAHPVDWHVFPNLNIGMTIPYGRAINPVTGINWEGVGVKPHIEVSQEQALAVARSEALKKLIEKTTDEDRERALNWSLAALESELHPVELNEAVLKSYAGSYGPRKILYEDGELYYQREGRPKYKMIPMDEETFMFKEIDFFRLKFIKDSGGRVVEVVGMYDSGATDSSPRDDIK